MLTVLLWHAVMVITKRYLVIHKIPGQTYLWLAVIIFGASSAITRKLTEIGAEHLIGDRNPISLCNVLFVGNLCALMVLIGIYWQQWNTATLKRLTKKDWLNLTIVAILSGAIVPSLIFQALAITNVNNVVLVGRLEPPVTMALSVWFLKERVHLGEFLGAFLAFLGVGLTILLQPPEQNMMNMPGFRIDTGEILTVLGAVAAAVATIIGKRGLSQIPVGIYSIFRTALGTVIFFCIALIIYGSDHFMDALSPFLWQWMLVYGFVIVVLGQSFWLRGLNACTVSVASIVGSFTPVVSIVAAYLILGEVPTKAQYIGGGLILLGIFLSQMSISNHPPGTGKFSMTSSTPADQKIEAGMGFKGI